MAGIVDQVQAIFDRYGLDYDFNYGGGTTTETGAERLARIAEDIRTGRRTLAQVEASVARQAQDASFGTLELQLERLFKAHGLPLDRHLNGTTEVGAARILRLAREIRSGERTFAQVATSIERVGVNYRAGQAVEAGEEGGGAWAVLKGVLDQYGLGSMSDWLRGEVENNRSIDEVLLDLRQQPEFQQRFKAIGIRQSLGLNPVSPEDIINYENTARDMMRSSGLPKGFYDDFDDFADLIGKGVSLQSIQDRVENTWDRVVNAPPEIRQAFAELYGVRGDSALAAFMFDPDKAEVKLREMASTAVAGGIMKTFGFELQRQAAEKVGALDLSDEAVRGGFARLARLNAVFEETIGESQDLSAMGEGVNAMFEAGQGEEAIRRRVDQRLAAFGGSGGMLATQAGIAAGAEG